MTLGLGESRRLARRQRRRRRLQFVVLLAALGALGMVGYNTGKSLADQDLETAQRELKQLRGAIEKFEQENQSLRLTAEEMQLRVSELQRRLEIEVPDGDRSTLLALVDEQLRKGANVERLRFLISAASRQERCSGRPTTKRFLVRTPDSGRANSMVTFAEGALAVSARGEPAQDAQGRTQAWFDPSKPVTLELTRLGEKPETITSTIPLQHALIVNGSEYRLRLVAGERTGFAEVTADQCQIP